MQQTLTLRSKQYGVVFAALLFIDLVTGSPLWVQYIGVIMAAMLAWQACPLWITARFGLRYLRTAVVSGAFFLLNVLTWDGEFWAIWPIGVMIFVEVMRRMRVRA